MKKKLFERPDTFVEKEATVVGRNEYVLLLKPDENLQEKIMEEKKIFFEKYKSSATLNSKPHIILVKFFQWESMEEKIIQRLTNIANAQHPFMIALDGFGSFPSHTIFFNVVSKTAVQELVKQMRPIQHLLKSKEDEAHLIMEPHIMLARKLASRQYEQSWLEYEHKHFTGRCVAENMLLIKKSEKEKYYSAVKQFPFTSQVKKIEQGNLFG